MTIQTCQTPHFQTYIISMIHYRCIPVSLRGIVKLKLCNIGASSDAPFLYAKKGGCVWISITSDIKGIDKEDKFYLINYLKSKELYINEPITESENE